MSEKWRGSVVGIGKLVTALVAAGSLVAGVALPFVGGLGLAAKAEAATFLNTTCNLKPTPPPLPTTLYARDGTTVIARIFREDRVPVSLSRVPNYLQQALIATEDRRFYENDGIDLRGILRSAISIGSGGATEGASTLTMQYVKQVRFYQDIGNPEAQHADIAQTLPRKIEDAKCALAFEKRESKKQILDGYLNIAYFGEQAYGIESAARTYFGTDVDKLTLPQAALLVGLLQAPTAYDPFLNPQAALQRRNQVIQNLVEVGDLSPRAAARDAATPIALATTRPSLPSGGCGNASGRITNSGFFCDYVEHWLTQDQGLSENELETGGLKIVTTLDAGLQDRMERSLRSVMPAGTAMAAVMPVVDPRTGDVLAMVTNRSYGPAHGPGDRSHTELPLFTSYSASGASTWKLFSLLAALELGVSPKWSLNTDPTGYTTTECTSGSTARNGDANEPYTENETLASATAKSSNTFFVGMDDVLFGCDLHPIVQLAEALGMNGLALPEPGDPGRTIAADIVDDDQVLPIALGSGLATSPLELTGAYAAVADGGRFNQPAPILSITTANGRQLAVKRSPGRQVVSPQAAAEAVHLLAGDTTDSYGTSYQAFRNWYAIDPSIVAGKTGTAVSGGTGQQNSALWFVGLTPQLVATTAVINPQHPYGAIPALPGVGDPADNAYGDYASSIWVHTLSATLQDRSWQWPAPRRVNGQVVPDVTGEPLGDAERTLTAAGYRARQMDAQDQLECASAEPLGSVAFFGPTIAPRGATITLCPSTGIPPTAYSRPQPEDVSGGE